MRKLLFALAVVVVTLAVAAPDLAFAATAKFSGIWRFRGVSADDGDRNELAHDSRQNSDMMVRPRWSIASKGNNVKVFVETDITDSSTFGGETGRASVEMNRWAVDALIPGTTLRYQWGRTDGAGPGNTGKRLIGGYGTYRFHTHKLYGKLTSNLSLSMFNAQISEGTASNTDDNDYYLSVGWKAAPNLTISPFVLWTKHNGEIDQSGVNDLQTTLQDTAVALGEEGRDIVQIGANLKAKFGILSLDALGLIQDGTIQFSDGVHNAGRKNTHVDAYVVMLQAWLNLGKLKVGFYGTFMPGDDDVTSEVGLLGTQTDDTLSRYVPGGNSGTANAGRGGCRIDGPQIFSGVRYHTMGTGFTSNACGSGDGGSAGNGVHIFELLGKYKMSKALEVAGNFSVIRSAAKRAPLGTARDGVITTDYVNSKDIGTEFDISAKYTLHKNLWTRMTFAYLWAGDYGKATGTSVRGFDDTWAFIYELRSTF
jgi:hypothetical protein